MASSGHNPITQGKGQPSCGSGQPEANTGRPLKGDFERMARRRFQNPRPFRRGKWWCLLYWQDNIVGGKCERKHKWAKLAPTITPEREVRKIAAELLRPM